MTTPMISAIIPTFNREAFLPRAIESVLSQTFPVCELIIVDDGSTDGTRAMVAKLAVSDPRVILVSQERGGANRARNAGAALARGDWLAFLDSDDIWEDEKLARQIAALAARNDAVASFTGLRMLSPGGEKVFLPPAEPSLVMIRSANVLSSTSSALVRSDVFCAAGGFDPTLPSCQDWDLWFRLRKRGPFAVVRSPLVRFIDGPHERITSNIQRVLEGHIVVFARLRAGLKGMTLRRVDAKHKLSLASTYLAHGRARQALAQAASSVASWPSLWGARLFCQSAIRFARASRPNSPES